MHVSDMDRIYLSVIRDADLRSIGLSNPMECVVGNHFVPAVDLTDV